MKAKLLTLLVALAAGSLARAEADLSQPAPLVEPFPGTAPLTMEGDLAAAMVQGIDRFLLQKLEVSGEVRSAYWNLDHASWPAYEKSLGPNRERLAQIIGLRDEPNPDVELELVATTEQPALFAQNDRCQVLAVRWLAFGKVHGEGLWLKPAQGPVRASLVAIPDADQWPEEMAGLEVRLAGKRAPIKETGGGAWARALAEAGCQVIIPQVISRELAQRQSPNGGGAPMLTHREYLYRPAFELGRHLIGYEVRKILAAVAWSARSQPGAPIGVIGWGEGGMLALYAAALDTRIKAAAVSGYFNDRRGMWAEPIDRNVFGLLERFGDAELAAMVAPRCLIIEAALGPELELPGKGGAPARLVSPALEKVQAEFARAQALVKWPAGQAPQPALALTVSGDGRGPAFRPATLEQFAQSLGLEKILPQPPEALPAQAPGPDPQKRLRRQIEEMDAHSQQLLVKSPYVRNQFMKKLDATSPERYRETSREYREFFAKEVIGSYPDAFSPPNPRSRRISETGKYTAYEVVLDVYHNVFAEGIFLWPKDLKAGERRPVVVCQHGLEGRPRDIVYGDHSAYHGFAAKLAERGFIVFAPQNPYIFTDQFRTLQRKSYPLKKTLFSIIVPQHRQILNWLKTVPNVDPQRMAFYGLSYGGKTAMRVPALIEDYCLSICSADFNDWVWKNASTLSPYSYVWSGEYEIFEFDLGSTFNYAEMAALIAPRPFMVERGHFDGVAPDETVGYEFAKVRHLYAARLGLPGNCAIEWFKGPHTINGQGTYDFLHQHLRWPKPGAN